MEDNGDSDAEAAEDEIYSVRAGSGERGTTYRRD